ncbi:10845_t:CDS:2 [Funneliformis geosporum]|uniref:2456_t:CDS:1 n=1 Tax=Funneliformis geosporum TaxID=1117311 RepID=A0A9W4SYH8_9GLOM|nr:10845_t:CDS:2 [Funneliformis geosporum]CAI2185260.1 2456_t:CDS:2 [Funneliformis geosporum]
MSISISIPTITLSYSIPSTIIEPTISVEPTVTDIFETDIIDTIIIPETPPSTSPSNSLDDPSIPGNISSASIRDNDRIPIIIHQQKALASAIVAAETREISMSDSPSPLPPPTPPPTPLPHVLLRDDENSQHLNITIEAARPPPRYKISTLQIEPMTRRLTMNLSQKGKSIIINEDTKSTPRGSEFTRDGNIKEEEEEDCCQEIINVVSLRDGDDDYGFYGSSDEENENKGGKRFSVRKSFWK